MRIRRTGQRHPSQPDSYKRAVAEVTLTDAQEQLWYGVYIEVTEVDFVLIPL